MMAYRICPVVPDDSRMKRYFERNEYRHLKTAEQIEGEKENVKIWKRKTVSISATYAVAPLLFWFLENLLPK